MSSGACYRLALATEGKRRHGRQALEGCWARRDKGWFGGPGTRADKMGSPYSSLH